MRNILWKKDIPKKLMALALILAWSCMPAMPVITAEASRESSLQGKVPEYVTADTYGEYLDSHASAESGKDTVVLKGVDYAGTEGMDVSVEDRKSVV